MRKSLFIAVFFIFFPLSLFAFNDVTQNHDFSEAIEYVRSKGIVSGYSDGTFRPEKTINRAEFVKIIIGAQFDKEDIDSCISMKDPKGDWLYIFFSDVHKEDWFAPYICVAKINNVISGYPDGTFRSENNISFVEAAKIIAKTFKIDKEGASGSAWYSQFADALSQRKAIPQTITTLNKSILRGEMAEMIWRLKEGIQSAQYSKFANDTLQPENSSLAQNIKPVPRNINSTSNFFSGDSNYEKIIQGNAYDMNDLNYFTNKTSLNKDVFAFKIFSALKMLGYNTYAGTNEVGNKSHIIALNQFQKKHGLASSEKLDGTTLSKLNEELVNKEKTDSAYKNKFLLYANISGLHKNDVSKEHVAMLFSIPFEVLPDKYQLKTKEQLIECFSAQCAGVWRNNTFTDPYISDAEGDLSALQPDSITLISSFHEFAHYLDGALSPSNETLKYGIIDTRGFYNISFKDVDKVDQLPLGEKNCFDRRTTDDFEFITSYAMSNGAYHTAGCGDEKYKVAEDFAESFAAYVGSGKQFRLASKKHSIINQKYQWLKKNVFEGIEYDTDLIWGNASGCNDTKSTQHQTPGYMSCNEEYVWDGTLPQLKQ